MNRIDFDSLGKWLAITACIVMAGILELHGKHEATGGFVTAAIVIGFLA